MLLPCLFVWVIDGEHDPVGAPMVSIAQCSAVVLKLPEVVIQMLRLQIVLQALSSTLSLRGLCSKACWMRQLFLERNRFAQVADDHLGGREAIEHAAVDDPQRMNGCFRGVAEHHALQFVVALIRLALDRKRGGGCRSARQVPSPPPTAACTARRRGRRGCSRCAVGRSR